MQEEAIFTPTPTPKAASPAQRILLDASNQDAALLKVIWWIWSSFRS